MFIRIGGDGIDVGGFDDVYSGFTIVFYVYVDIYGNFSNDFYDEYNFKYYVSNCCVFKMRK